MAYFTIGKYKLNKGEAEVSNQSFAKQFFSIKVLSLFVFFTLFFLPLFADYTDDVQKGNDAYKAQNWSVASAYYKSAYAANQDPTLKKFLDYCVAMAYREGVTKGYAAYKANRIEEAIKWYQSAYDAYPTKQVKDFIAKLKAENAIPDMGGQEIQAKPQEANPVFKWALIGGDVVLVGASVITYFSASSAADSYNNLWSQIDDTTMDNYNTLVSKKSSAQQSENIFGTLAIVSSIAVVYTLADVLFIHAAFPKDISLNIDYKGDRFAMAITKEF